jgi:hypothetical protein
MSLIKILLVGGAAVGAIILLERAASARPTPPVTPPTALPPGWTPPPGATFTQIPADQNFPIPLDRFSWRDSQGLGTNVLLFAHSSPTDFVAVFVPDNRSQQVGILAVGTTPMSKTLAQAAVAAITPQPAPAPPAASGYGYAGRY